MVIARSGCEVHRWLVALGTLAVLALPAAAHDVGLARLAVEVTDGPRVAVVLDGRIADLVQLLDLPEGVPIPPRVFERALPAAIDGWVAIRADGAPCALALDRFGQLDALALRLELTAVCRAAPVDLTIDWPAAGDPRLRWSALVAVTTAAGVLAPEVLGREQPTVTVRVGAAPPPVEATVWRFGLLGVEHIVLGWDHLAFVLALMLSCGRLRRLLAVVTGFTVAHSVTLGLGATGLVELPAAVVEPVIALSIAVAAGLALRRLGRGELQHPGSGGAGAVARRRADGSRAAAEADGSRAGAAGGAAGGATGLMALCFGFGLMHGFGFAGLLGELLPPGEGRLWPLLGFNVGVEIGQVACVAVMWPVLTRIGRGRATRYVVL